MCGCSVIPLNPHARTDVNTRARERVRGHRLHVRGTGNITDPPSPPAAGRSAQSRGASRVQTANRDRSNPRLVNKHLQPAHLLSCAPGTSSSAGSRASVSGSSSACSSVTCTTAPGGVRAHSGILKTHRGKRSGRGHARLRHSRERGRETKSVLTMEIRPLLSPSTLCFSPRRRSRTGTLSRRPEVRRRSADSSTASDRSGQNVISNMRTHLCQAEEKLKYSR